MKGNADIVFGVKSYNGFITSIRHIDTSNIPCPTK